MRTIKENIEKLGEMHDLAVLNHINRKDISPPNPMGDAEEEMKQAINALHAGLDRGLPSSKKMCIRQAMSSLQNALEILN